MTRGRPTIYQDPYKTSLTCERFLYQLCMKLEHGPTAVFEAGLKWVIDKAIRDSDKRLTEEDIQTYRRIINKQLDDAIMEINSANGFTEERLDKAEATKEQENPQVAGRTYPVDIAAINEKEDRWNSRYRQFRAAMDPLFSFDAMKSLDENYECDGEFIRNVVNKAMGLNECDEDTLHTLCEIVEWEDIDDFGFRWIQDRLMEAGS